MQSNMKLKSKNLIGDVFIDIVSGLIIGLGVNMFTAPNNIVPGAIMGIATFFNYLFGLPIGTGMQILNAPLLLLAYIFLGKKFTFSTLRTVLIQTLIFDNAFDWVTPYADNSLLAAIFGGAFIGMGIGICLHRGSSTGGSDIAGRLLQKIIPHLSMGKALLIFDGSVMALSVFIFNDVEPAMLGAITLFISSKMVDAILLGVDSGVVMFIITTKPREVCQEIFNQMGRGATLLNSQGSFNKVDGFMVFCAIRRNQSATLKKLVYDVDEEAFVVASEVHEVLGKGFNPIVNLK